MNVILMCIIIIVCGFFVGVMSGLIGIGGGSLVIPLLNVGFGLPILNATATSLFTVFCTSLSGSIGHLRNKTCNLKMAIVFAIPGLCLSPVGALLAGSLPGVALSLITAGIMLIPLGQNIYSAIRQHQRKVKDPACVVKWSETHLDMRTVVICVCGGGIAGFCSGMVGLGGGFIIIPVMSGLLHRGMHETTATSIAYICIVSIAGTITHAIAGDIQWLYGIGIAVGSIPGALVGSKISEKVDGIVLKVCLICVLAVVIVLLIIKAL